MPRAIIIRTAGTNCDAEMVRAFELAGARADLVHLDALIADPHQLDAFDIIGLPGGFSYGDDIASGRILAMKLRNRLYPALRDAAQRGCPMIGVCNGFQVMVQAGLLPGPVCADDISPSPSPPTSPWPAAPLGPTVTLTENKLARFVDRCVGVEPVAASPCIWTRPLVEWAQNHPQSQSQNQSQSQAQSQAHALMLPVAHCEGRFLAQSPAVLASLAEHHQIALRYTDNFNGSIDSIAGICDRTGRLFGLMPHPDRFLAWNRHPFWTRLDAAAQQGPTPGLAMFQAAVDALTHTGV